MLTCKQLAQLHASDYLDGNLSFWQQASVRLHLLMCRPCRRFMQQMSVAKRVIAARQAPTADEQAMDLVMQLMQVRAGRKTS